LFARYTGHIGSYKNDEVRAPAYRQAGFSGLPSRRGHQIISLFNKNSCFLSARREMKFLLIPNALWFSPYLRGGYPASLG
jgi:hypothetical protein